MIKKLRPYQKNVVDNLKKRLKDVTHPLLVNMSVGAGKSLVIASVLEWISSKNYRALCLTLNSTLIQQNYETYKNQGLDAGVYCAGLNEKDTSHHIIFGSPQSICQAIKNNEEVSYQKFNMIVIDEAHNIDPHNMSTMYQKIINHYGHMAQLERYSYRVLGLTGTPYRGKAESIIGENAFFKEEVCNISSSWLIENGYLLKPIFGITRVDAIDFSECNVENTGKFRHKDLEKAIHKNERLTGEIMKELQTIDCNGIFIFASTRKHCEECARSLPDGQWKIITGETPHEERKNILLGAKTGHIKYLISVNCLGVGVDVPNFDACAWLRPTESLVLYTQGIGRVLRLSEGKHRAIVLDYAGNLDRHGDIDDPIINEALKPSIENEKDYVIPCYSCGTNNTVHARRCIGLLDNKRCDHFFEFKDCIDCGTTNDITSRACRECDAELIDPNKKLKKIRSEQFNLSVKQAKYWVNKSDYPIINAQYVTDQGNVFETHYMKSEKSKNICYAKFVRHHIPKGNEYYMKLMHYESVKQMIETSKIITPYSLVCKKNEYGRFEILKKIFN